MDMERAGTRFEVRVGTLVSAPLLAALRVPLGRIAVPRHRIHRLRLSADQDVPAVVRRLTERDIEIVEIRRCPAPPRRHDAAVPDRPAAPLPEPAGPPDAPDGVVVPFRRRLRPGAGDSAG
jgi:hypothetical protein